MSTLISLDPALNVKNIGCCVWQSLLPEHLDILHPEANGLDIYQYFERYVISLHPDKAFVEGTVYMGSKSQNQTYVKLTTTVAVLKERYGDLIELVDPQSWKRAICGCNKKPGKKIIKQHLISRGFKVTREFMRSWKQHDLDAIGMLFYKMDIMKREGIL